MTIDELTTSEVEEWYRRASSHLYGGVFYTTLWELRIGELGLRWEHWIEDHDLLDWTTDPRMTSVEPRLVEQRAFGEILSFLRSVLDDVGAGPIDAMRAEVDAMRRGTFRPCVGTHEIEELYDYKGGPLFEEAWEGIEGLADLFPSWVSTEYPRVSDEWSRKRPIEWRERYPRMAICELESLLTDQVGSQTPVAEFHASLPPGLAARTAEALENFRQRYGS